MEGESRKMSLKDKVKEVVLGYRASSDSYVKHLRKIGVEIGEDVVLFRPYNKYNDRYAKSALTNYRESCDDYGACNNFNT